MAEQPTGRIVIYKDQAEYGYFYDLNSNGIVERMKHQLDSGIPEPPTVTNFNHLDITSELIQRTEEVIRLLNHQKAKESDLESLIFPKLT